MIDDLKNILDALLFVAEDPLPMERLRQVLPEAETRDIRTALYELEAGYTRRDGPVHLVQVAGGWQLRTRPAYTEWIQRLLRPAPQRLSRAALETMAIVAYKQPVIRADIEHVRGVDSGGVLRLLLERRLIRVLGRKEIPGRPLIYATTKKFLEVFELKDLKDLPTPAEIAALGDSPAERIEGLARQLPLPIRGEEPAEDKGAKGDEAAAPGEGLDSEPGEMPAAEAVDQSEGPDSDPGEMPAAEAVDQSEGPDSEPGQMPAAEAVEHSEASAETDPDSQDREEEPDEAKSIKPPATSNAADPAAMGMVESGSETLDARDEPHMPDAIDPSETSENFPSDPHDREEELKEAESLRPQAESGDADPTLSAPTKTDSNAPEDSDEHPAPGGIDSPETRPGLDSDPHDRD